MKYLSFILLISFALCNLSCGKEDLQPGEITLEEQDKQPNKVVLNKVSKVISTNALEGASRDGNILSVQNLFGDSVIVGTIIISAITDEFPQGLLIKVLEINPVSNEYIIEDATLEEAFDEFRIRFSLDDFYRSTKRCLDLNEIHNVWDEAHNANAVPERKFTFTDDSQLCFDTDFILEEDPNDGNSYIMGFEPLTTTFKGEIRVHNSGQGNLADKEWVLLNKPIEFTVPVGPIPVPVIINLKLVASVKVDYKFYASMDIGFDYTNNIDGKTVTISTDPYGITQQPPSSSSNPVIGSGLKRPTMTAVGDGEIKFTVGLDVITSLYHDKLLKFNPVEGEFVLNLVAEICAAVPPDLCHDCPATATLDMFYDAKISGSVTVANSGNLTLPWTYYESNNNSIRLGRYCSNCAFIFSVEDNPLACLDGNTPDDLSDDLIIYELIVDLKTPNGQPTGSNGYKIFLEEDEFIKDENGNDKIFTYNQTEEITIDSDVQEIFLIDNLVTECVTGIPITNICDDAEEPGSGQVDIPACMNKKIDSRDNNEYCKVKICEEGSNTNCLTWLRRNLRYNGGGGGPTVDAPYMLNDSKRWKTGRLYSYAEVMSGNLCPSGYRVASKEDFESLITAIENKNTTYSGNPTKYITANYAWPSSSKGNGGQRYSRWLEVFPNGYYSIWDNQFQDAGKSANLWTTSPYIQNGQESTESVYAVAIKNGDFEFIPFVKEAFRLGVRCVCETGC